MDLQSSIKQCQLRINDVLRSYLAENHQSPSRLQEAMEYSTLDAGKRLRPLLVYSCGEAFGAAIKDLDGVAAAVECIHVYSLIHDDLPAMDDDDLRRGKATCHIHFDEATAILAGDALQTLAFNILINHPLSDKAEPFRLSMLKELACASGSGGMGGGQMLDLQATNRSLQLEELKKMHRMKTGALIRASIIMALHCSGISDKKIFKALSEFGELIGLAFQVKDDILDVEGDTNVMGKPTGSDTDLNKSTFPALMGLEAAKDYAEQLVTEALQALSSLPYNTQRLKQLAAYIIQRQH
ncbi:MAG: (2E,6E)-farnesyl diphosphate synthase [Gammaproteobacteria bacterium]|nr:MAG: (2E,6E)-farnesyl diphosphate synthase [Gammaproteobacteria bacterium]